MRSMGGLPVERWRSKAFCSAISLKKESMRAMAACQCLKLNQCHRRGGAHERGRARSSGHLLARGVENGTHLLEELEAGIGLRDEAAQTLGEHRANLALLGETAAQ